MGILASMLNKGLDLVTLTFSRSVTYIRHHSPPTAAEPTYNHRPTTDRAAAPTKYSRYGVTKRIAPREGLHLTPSAKNEQLHEMLYGHKACLQIHPVQWSLEQFMGPMIKPTIISVILLNAIHRT